LQDGHWLGQDNRHGDAHLVGILQSRSQPGQHGVPQRHRCRAPDLTVRKRLDVLKPDHDENYYKTFDLVPPAYREYMNKGRVLVTNWHAFAPKSPNSEGGSTYKVVVQG